MASLETSRGCVLQVCVLSGAANPFTNSGAPNPFPIFELHLGRINNVLNPIGLTITPCTLTGGEGVVRELMEILGLTALNVVKMIRKEHGSHGGAPRSSPAREIAEAVMGRIAWDIYKNIEYKRMTGSRRPQGSAKVEKHVKARNKKLGGSMTGWSCKCEPEHLWMTHSRGCHQMET